MCAHVGVAAGAQGEVRWLGGGWWRCGHDRLNLAGATQMEWWDLLLE